MYKQYHYEAALLKFAVSLMVVVCCSMSCVVPARAQSGSVLKGGSGSGSISKPDPKPKPAPAPKPKSAPPAPKPVPAPKPKPAPPVAKPVPKPRTPKPSNLESAPSGNTKPPPTEKEPSAKGSKRATVSTPGTTSEIDALINDANELERQKKTDTCLLAADKYRQASERLFGISNKQGHATQVNNVGVAFFCASEYDPAIEWFDKASRLYHELGSFMNEADALDSAAKACNAKKDAAQSAAYYLRATAIYQTLKMNQRAAETVFYAAKMHDSLKGYAKAREGFQKAVEIYRILGDGKNELRALWAIASTYENENNYALAVEAFNLALAVARIASPSDVPHLLNNIGNRQRQLGEYEKALVAHQEALSLFQAQANAALVKATQTYIEQAGIESEKAKEKAAVAPPPTPLPIVSPTPPPVVAPVLPPVATPTPTPTPTPPLV